MSSVCAAVFSPVALPELDHGMDSYLMGALVSLRSKDGKYTVVTAQDDTLGIPGFLYCPADQSEAAHIRAIIFEETFPEGIDHEWQRHPVTWLEDDVVLEDEAMVLVALADLDTLTTQHDFDISLEDAGVSLVAAYDEDDFEDEVDMIEAARLDAQDDFDDDYCVSGGALVPRYSSDRYLDAVDRWESGSSGFTSSLSTHSGTGSLYASSGGKGVKSAYYCPDPAEGDTYVWYLAYGSNLNVERFLRYLNAGRSGMEEFAPDDLTSARVGIPHGVYFAKSGRWGSGGIAFLDVDRVESFTSSARVYRLPLSHFHSVLRQENGGGSYSVSLDEIKGKRSVKAGSGMYGRVVNMGSINGEPVLTVTSNTTYVEQVSQHRGPLAPQYLAQGMLNPPTHEYLSIINEGSVQTEALDEVTLDPFVPAPVEQDKSEAASTKAQSGSAGKRAPGRSSRPATLTSAVKK